MTGPVNQVLNGKWWKLFINRQHVDSLFPVIMVPDLSNHIHKINYIQLRTKIRLQTDFFHM